MTRARELAELAAAYDSGGLSNMKNRIINGGMVIDQRNNGASVTQNTSVQYTLDRWIAYGTVTSKFTVQQNAGSVTPPVGFSNYLGVTSSSAYSVGSSDLFQLVYRVEGFNVSDFAWGTANAQTVTLSFWVRSSLTGTFGGSVGNSGNSRQYPFSYTISSANTWEQKSVTIPGDTTGTWLTNNGIGLYISIGLGAGSTFSGTAGAWTASNAQTTTGAVSVVGTNGATFYITGVQLEKGIVSTPFDFRPYTTELQLCQRYYLSAPPNSATNNASGAYTTLQWPVNMRSAPTVVVSSGSVTAATTYGAQVLSAGVSGISYTASIEL